MSAQAILRNIILTAAFVVMLSPNLISGERLFDLSSRDSWDRPCMVKQSSKEPLKQQAGPTRKKKASHSVSQLFLGQTPSGGNMPPLRLDAPGTQQQTYVQQPQQQYYTQPVQQQYYSPQPQQETICQTYIPEETGTGCWSNQAWHWQLFPYGMIYQNYLAGVNESRMAGVWNNDKDLDWIWDITLGGRAPILRYGNKNPLHPEGFQLDIEGSAHLRLDYEHAMDVDATDFRFGVPFSYGNRVWQFKTGYYHVSSHLGDERILRLEREGIYHNRINYVREAWIFGFSYRIRPSFRVYAEADIALWTGECTKPLHFQFGAEYASMYPTNEFWGKPFAAVNILLLQEHDYDGSICLQAGWQWRGTHNQVFRFGLQYFGGVSEQYEHIAHREHKFGIGLWYDF